MFNNGFKWQFSLKSLLILIAVVSVNFALLRWSPEWAAIVAQTTIVCLLLGSTIASFLLPRHVRAFYIGFAICGLYGLNGGYEGTLTGKCVSILSSKLSEIYSENTSSTAESSTTVNPYSPPMLSGQFGIIVNKYCQEWVTAWAVLFVGFLGGCFASWLSAKRERDEQAATNKSG